MLVIAMLTRIMEMGFQLYSDGEIEDLNRWIMLFTDIEMKERDIRCVTTWSLSCGFKMTFGQNQVE